MSKWCTIKKPRKNGRYLVTIETPFGRQVRQADMVEFPENNWYFYVLPNGGFEKVIAWQKCPNPYEGEKTK